MRVYFCKRPKIHGTVIWFGRKCVKQKKKKKSLWKGLWFCNFVLWCFWVCCFLWQYSNIYCIETVGVWVSARTDVHTFTFPFAVTVRQYTITGCGRVRFLLCVCTFSAFQHPACTDTELLSCKTSFCFPVCTACWSRSRKNLYLYFFFLCATMCFCFSSCFFFSHICFLVCSRYRGWWGW